MRIISLPVDDGGCGWYRVRQPLAFMNAHTDHEGRVFDAKKYEMIALIEALMLADVWMFRQGSSKAIDYLKEQKELSQSDPFIVIDVDDNAEEVSPYSIHYESWGTKNFKHDGMWLWKDGEKKFDIATNKRAVQGFIDSIKSAHLVTCTTKKLEGYIKQYNANTAIVPNSLDFNSWWKPNFKKNKTLRIGWAGGASHYEDLYTVRDALNQILRDFDVTFVNIGHMFRGIFDDDVFHKVEDHGWVPFKGHSYRMMCMNLDIAIAPLMKMEFNYYKSPIKYVEYSAMSVPTIATNIPPYSPAIEHNKTGMLFDTEEEFYHQLKYLIQNEDIRVKIGKEANKYVRKHYDQKRNIKRHAREIEQRLIVHQRKNKSNE